MEKWEDMGSRQHQHHCCGDWWCAHVKKKWKRKKEGTTQEQSDVRCCHIIIHRAGGLSHRNEKWGKKREGMIVRMYVQGVWYGVFDPYHRTGVHQ